MIDITGLTIKPITQQEFNVYHINLIQAVAKEDRNASKQPTFA